MGAFLYSLCGLKVIFSGSNSPIQYYIVHSHIRWGRVTCTSADWSSTIPLDQWAPSCGVVTTASIDACFLHCSARNTIVAYIRKCSHVLHAVLTEQTAMGLKDTYLKKMFKSQILLLSRSSQNMKAMMYNPSELQCDYASVQARVSCLPFSWDSPSHPLVACEKV